MAEFEEEDPLESLMKHVKEKEAKEGQGNDEDDDLEYPSMPSFSPSVCALAVWWSSRVVMAAMTRMTIR